MEKISKDIVVVMLMMGLYHLARACVIESEIGRDGIECDGYLSVGEVAWRWGFMVSLHGVWEERNV